MSHITASPPSSPPSQASGPHSGAHNSLVSLSASEREALFLPRPMSSKTVMNAMQWPRKWTLEKEREKKKAILRLWRSIITLLPSPRPLPSRAGVCVHIYIYIYTYVSVCVCVPAITCVSKGLCGWVRSCEFVWVCTLASDCVCACIYVC